MYLCMIEPGVLMSNTNAMHDTLCEIDAFYPQETNNFDGNNM